VIVVKIGGGEGIGFETLCDDVAALINAGERIVIVHGASHATNVLSERLNHPAQTITSPSGHTSRRTDRQTLEIFQMACRGIMNQSLVLELLKRGVDAVGLSGIDARLWVGERKAAVRSIEDGRIRIIRDDYTGAVERVDPRVLNTLLDAGFTPVISPPGLSTSNEAINVDADRAAAQTAIALNAEALVLLSNVPGLLARYPDESSLLTSVPASGIEAATGMAQGRMKKKVLAAGEALAGGVSRVIIADARTQRPVSVALEGAGTVFA
jgi:acetylglutamate/LysW-gamma-L-alpha-aminoadipate kinase